MPPVDSLPADQRAVVQLVLRLGPCYDEIAGLLKISPAAVAERAHGALAALGPQETGLAPERRDELADFLLGQRSDPEAASTRAFLEGSAAGRAWSRVVAGELRPLAGDALPEIPAEGAPAVEAAPAAAAPAALAADEGSAAVPAPAGLRSSRIGGLVLILGALIVAAVVVVLIVGSGGSDDKKAASTTAASTPTQTSTNANVLGQAKLTSPAGAKKTIGVVQLVQQGSQLIMRAVAQGLPTPSKSAGYGVWLYTSPSKATWLGYFQVVTKQGQAVAQGQLTVDPRQYKQVLITEERGRTPKRPGRIVLRGPLTLA